MAINPELLRLAQAAISQNMWDTHSQKQAVVPAGGGMPPDAGMAGAMPGAMPGGMPGAAPVDPAMMGAAAGGAPPMPSAVPGMPPMMPGMPPMAAAPAPTDPAAAAGTGQKMKPEQMFQQISMQIYMLQQQITAIMNGLNIPLSPGAVVLPPNMGGPIDPSLAMPGGPLDPATQQQQQAPQNDGGTAPIGQPIEPIEPMQTAAPTKQAEEFLEEAQAQAPFGYRVVLVPDTLPSKQAATDDSDIIVPRVSPGVPRVESDNVADKAAGVVPTDHGDKSTETMRDKASALLTLLRHRR